MSYIPKYIIKRMIPTDAVKIDGENLNMSMVNVISPISIDEIPDDVLNYIEVKIDDKVVMDASKPEASKKMQIKWQEKVFTMANIKSAAGETLPVGGKLTIIMPNLTGLKTGETHKFAVTIKTDNPINIEFERTLS